MHPWHAWCGPVCVPKPLHRGWLDKGHPAAWLLAFYARTCAAVSTDEARRAVDEFKFWRAALNAELAAPSARASPHVHQAPAAENVWTQALARIETQVNRTTFYTGFRETVLVSDDGAVIAVGKPGATREFAEWLEKYYHGLVDEVLTEIRPGTRVRFVVVAESGRKYG